MIMGFIGMFFASVFVQNAILARGFGVNKMLRLPKSVGLVLLFGLLTSFICVVGGSMSFGAVLLLKGWAAFKYFKTPLFVLCISLVYIAIYVFARSKKNRGLVFIKENIGNACFNFVVLGTILIVNQNAMSFAEMLGFALGAGIGYSLATLLVQSIHARLELSEVPTIFKGFPITLIYIGLLSLAFVGLLGHGLPA